MAIDVIGILYDNADPLNPVEKLGWHVNATEPISAWVEFKINPLTPSRNFFGVDVVHCYKFDSKAQYESMKLEDDE